MEKRVGHFIDRKLPDVKSLDIYGEDEKEEHVGLADVDLQGDGQRAKGLKGDDLADPFVRVLRHPSRPPQLRKSSFKQR